MKTAISVPDVVFREADKLAKMLKISRSELYARAMAEFLTKRRSKAITDALNRVYDKEPATVDPALMRAQLRAIRSDDRW